MSAPPDDLDARLERREPLFERANINESLEPPAEIDRLVLARARAAQSNSADEERTRPPFFTLNQWAMPLGLAATLVLAIGIFMQLGPSTLTPTAAPSDERSARYSGEVVEEKPLLDAATATAAADKDAKSNDASTATSAVTPEPRAPATAAAAATEYRSMQLERADARIAQRRMREADAPLPAPAPPVATTPAASVAPVTVAASPPARAEESLASAESAPDEVAATSSVSAAPTAVGDVQNQSVLSAANQARDKAAAGSARGQRVPAKQAPTSLVLHSNPERWYEYILDLRADGKDLEADREWRELKKQFPLFQPPAHSER